MKEYKVVQTYLPEQCEQTMNHLAREGWLLHSITSHGNRLIVTFERDLPAQ